MPKSSQLKTELVKTSEWFCQELWYCI